MPVHVFRLLFAAIPYWVNLLLLTIFAVVIHRASGLLLGSEGGGYSWELRGADVLDRTADVSKAIDRTF